MTEKAKIAQASPYAARVVEDKVYFWCSCGKSTTQPYCDGSHKGSSFSPVKYVAHATEVVYFCGCKATAKGPLCDGTHKGLSAFVKS